MEVRTHILSYSALVVGGFDFIKIDTLTLIILGPIELFNPHDWTPEPSVLPRLPAASLFVFLWYVRPIFSETEWSEHYTKQMTNMLTSFKSLLHKSPVFSFENHRILMSLFPLPSVFWPPAFPNPHQGNARGNVLKVVPVLAVAPQEMTPISANEDEVIPMLAAAPEEVVPVSAIEDEELKVSTPTDANLCENKKMS